MQLSRRLRRCSLCGLCGSRCLLLLHLNERKMLLVRIEDAFLDQLSCLRQDRMDDIPEHAVLVLAAGHCDKQPLISLHNLDIVNSEHVVNGDGNDRPKPSLRDDLPDLDVCDFHCEFNLLALFGDSVSKSSLGSSGRSIKNMHGFRRSLIY